MPDQTTIEQKYRIAYCVEPLEGEGLTKAELKAHPKYSDGWGGTDKLIVASIIETEDCRSIQIHSRQHDGNGLAPLEIYEFVLLLIRQLALEGDLDDDKERMCWLFFNANLELLGLKSQDLDRARELFDTKRPILADRKLD